MNSFLANNVTVVQDAVVLLGKLPESWWGAFEQRHLWFEEDGEPKPTSQLSQDRRVCARMTIHCIIYNQLSPFDTCS